MLVHIILKKYIINFFQPHTLAYSEQDEWKKVIAIVQTNVFYTITDKYPLEYVFVYNFVSLNMSLFSLKADWIFVWTCPCVCSKYWVNFPI